MLGRAAKVNVRMPLYGFAAQNGRLFVKLPGGLDPNGQALRFSPPTWGEEGRTPVVKINQSPHVILDGFRIEGSGTYCVRLDRESHHVTIRNTVLSYCRYGAQLPDHSLIEWSEYTYPGFHDFSEQVRQVNGNTLRNYELVKEYFPAWLEGGLATSYGKNHASEHCEFRYNYIHETFDGERLGHFENSESHHNVYLYNYDNHVELENWAGHGSRNLRLHHSLFLASPGGAISHQEYALEGPQYVYRNVIYGLDDHGWNAWTLIKSKAPSPKAKIFYYHNLLWGAKGQLFWDEIPPRALHMRNNIMIFTRNLNRVPSLRGFDSKSNLLVNDRDEPRLYGKQGKYVGADAEVLAFQNVPELNFGITAKSPAHDAGMILPGFNDDATGPPDIGPFEVEKPPGADWPRPRRTIFTSTPPQGWSGPLPALVQP